MSIGALQTQSALQYLARPQPNGQPQQLLQSAQGGNDHDGDEIGGVDVGRDNDRGGRVNIKA